MITEVTEFNYKGILLEYVKGQGWKFTLGEDEYIFPHFTAARAAVDEFIKNVVPKHNGKLLPQAEVKTVGVNTELIQEIVCELVDMLNTTSTYLNKESDTINASEDIINNLLNAIGEFGTALESFIQDLAQQQ